MPWEECAETCTEKNAAMLCVESEAQNEYVWEQGHSVGHFFWLGYHDSDLNGTWEGPSGCESNYSNWADGHPASPTGNGEPGYAYAG